MSKVLLVEDDNNLREIYEARLQAEGYDITSAQDGEQALVVAKAEKPDLIISDVMMPKISGFEMLDILRNTQGLKETKVIMLTALGQADDRSRADSLGADRYLVKSQVTLEDIVKTAHDLLEGDAATAMPAAAQDTTDGSDAATPAADPIPTAQIAVSAPPSDVHEPAAMPAEPVTPSASAPEAPSIVTPPAEPSVVTPTEPTTPAPTESAPEPEAVSEAISGSEPAPVETPVEPTAPETVATPATNETATTETAPTPDMSSAPELPTTASTAEEQATVNNQIEDFIKNNAVEVPPEVEPAAPSAPPNENTDRIMQESVDSLIASTEPGAETPAPAAAPVTEAPAEPVPEPTPTPQEAPQSETSDNVTIAHKKVIARPDSTNKPDLGELLAREEAKGIVGGEAPQVVASEPTPAPTPVEAPATQADTAAAPAPQPGNTVTPSNAPPKATDGLDPNSVAL